MATSNGPWVGATGRSIAPLRSNASGLSDSGSAFATPDPAVAIAPAAATEIRSAAFTMSDGRASRAPASTACNVADIEFGGPNKNQHLTESLTPAVGGPTLCAVRIDHDCAWQPRHPRHAAPGIAELRVVVE